MTNTKAIEDIHFERICQDDGSITYEAHADLDLYQDTEETINSPTFIKIEGVKAKDYASRIETALQTQEQLENGYVMVRDVNVVSVTCPCGNTIQVNRNIAAQENDDE